MANKPNLIKTGAEIAFETTLDTTIDSDDTSLILTSADGLPSSNFCLILDYDVPTKREAVAIESRTGTTCTVYADGRGHDSTSATSHTGGVCKVRATILPSMVDEIIDAFDAEHDDDGKHTVDTIAEKTSGSGVTVDGLLIKDGGIMGWDGWQIDSDTWVYVSTTSFKIEGKDVTSTFTKGARIRYKQGGDYEYGIVSSSAFSTDTTVTLISNDTYELADATITDAGYSYADNPQGFYIASLRPTRFVPSFSGAFLGSVTDTGGFVDKSVNSITSDRAIAILARVWILGSGTGGAIYVRKNGDTTTGVSTKVVKNEYTDTSTQTTADFFVELDSSQVFEYDFDEDGGAYQFQMSLLGYWEYLP